MIHTKLLGALLLALVACCSGKITIEKFEFQGQYGNINFLVTNDLDKGHQFVCKLNFEKKTEVTDKHIRITSQLRDAPNKDDVIILDKEINPDQKREYTAQAYLAWPAELPDGFKGKVKFIAQIYNKDGNPDTPSNPKELTLHMLDVLHGSRPTDIKVNYENLCGVTVDVQYPFTFPMVKAECGGCTDVNGKCELGKDGAPYFSSAASGSSWTSKDKLSGRIGLSLPNKAFPLDTWTYKEGHKKYVKCQISALVKDGTYKVLHSKEIEINVNKKMDNCVKNKNPFMVAMKNTGNSYVATSKEYTKNCYKSTEKPKVETTSNYQCNAIKAKHKLFLTHCNDDGKYYYSTGEGEFNLLTKAKAEEYVAECNYKFKNLTVLPVELQSAYPNIINKEDESQEVTCSFKVGKDDFEKGPYTVSAQLVQDGKTLDTRKETKIEDKEIPDTGVKKFSIKGLKLAMDKLMSGRPTKLNCEISVDKFHGTKPEHVPDTELPVFDIHSVADESNAHVDGQSCRVKLNEIYRSYTNPKLFAFCGVWTAPSAAQYPMGKWLEAPDAKNFSLSFSSEIPDVWKTNTMDKKLFQLELKDKSINMGMLEGSKANWLKCIFRSDKKEAAGVFSDYTQLIDHHSDADKCADNPVESLDLKNFHAKMVVNEEVKSCYKGKNVKTSVTVKCDKTNSFSVVSCKNGQYTMHSGGKVINYDKNKMADFLKHCSSGARDLLASNSLLVALIVFLFFKSQ